MPRRVFCLAVSEGQGARFRRCRMVQGLHSATGIDSNGQEKLLRSAVREKHAAQSVTRSEQSLANPAVHVQLLCLHE